MNMKKPERALDVYVADVCEHTEIRSGVPLPLGTSESEGGVNFALFSRHASRVRLELFDKHADATPARVVDFDSARNRTGDVWHVWVEGIRPGQLYAYRVDGPYQPEKGHRFNFNKLLLDPFATAISPLPDWDFGAVRGYDPDVPEQDLVFSKVDDAGAMPKCVFTHEHFHWHDDRPPRHPWSRTVIYEAHVRGFTIHPSSGVEHRGTYRGLMEKISYLKELGVTAVELMPVHEFQRMPGAKNQSTDRQTAQKLLGLRSRGLLCAESVHTAVRAAWVSRSWSSRKWYGRSTMPASK